MANEIVTPIPARLKNVAKGGHVAGASDIVDDALQKEQSVVNAERIADVARLDGEIDAVEQKVEDIGDAIQFDQDGDLVTVDGSDFENPESRGKIPTIGAILDGADDVPTAGSEELVKSGGVFDAIITYPFSNIDFVGNGAELKEYQLKLKKFSLYTLRLSNTNWATSTISSSSAILSIGYFDENEELHNISWWPKSSQEQIPSTIRINTSVYEYKAFVIAFRGDVGATLKVEIEEEKVGDTLYESFQVTQDTQVNPQTVKIQCPINIVDFDLNVSCVVKTGCLNKVTIGYHAFGIDGVTPAVVNTDKFGDILSFVIPKNTILEDIALYASASDVIQTGNVEFSICVSNAESLLLESITDSIEKVNNTVEDLIPKDDDVYLKEITAVHNTAITSSASFLSVDIKAGTVFSITVVDNSRILFAQNTGYLLYQINFSDGTNITQLQYIPNVLQYRKEEKDVASVFIYAGAGAVVNDGTLSLRVATCKQMTNIDYYKRLKGSFFNFSILGDSWSTYYNWIPTGNSSWYAFDGIDGHNAQAGEEYLNNVNDVRQTWWWKLYSKSKIKLLADESQSGSCVANWNYGHHEELYVSFIPRMKKTIGEGRVTYEKPDLIIVEGGTNDMNAEAVIGELQYSDWTSSDLQKTIPAFCYILDYLKKWVPTAVIINIVNPNITTEIKEKMLEACLHYSVYNLEMLYIDRQNGHPSQEGMTQIENQVTGFLNGIVDGAFI